jgi:hypothetical protein
VGPASNAQNVSITIWKILLVHVLAWSGLVKSCLINTTEGWIQIQTTLVGKNIHTN